MNKGRQAADRAAMEQLNTMYPGLVFNLRFEHFDASGWWYSFELVNNHRRQTWCVRPSDLRKETLSNDAL